MFSEMFDVNETVLPTALKSQHDGGSPTNEQSRAAAHDTNFPPSQSFDIGPGFIPSKFYNNSMPMNDASSLFGSRGVPPFISRPPPNDSHNGRDSHTPTGGHPYKRRMSTEIVASSPPAHMDRRQASGSETPDDHRRHAAAFPGNLDASTPTAAQQLHMLQQAQQSQELSRYADLRALMRHSSQSSSSSSSSRLYDLANTTHGHGASHPPQPGMMLADSMSYHHAQPLGMPPPTRAYDAPVMSPRPTSPPKTVKRDTMASHLSALSQLSSQQAQAMAVAAHHRAEAERMAKHQSAMPPHASVVTHGAVVDGHSSHGSLPKHQNFDPATHFGMSHSPGSLGAGGSQAKRRVKRKKTTIACNHCYKAKAGCDLGRPCIRCIRLGKDGCVDRDPIPKTAKSRFRKARRKNQTSATDSGDSESKDDGDSESSSTEVVKTDGLAALCSVSQQAKSVLGTESVPLERISFLASFNVDEAPEGIVVKTEPNEGIMSRTKTIMASLPAMYADSELIAKTIAAFQSIVGSVALTPRQAQWLPSMAAYAAPMDTDTQRLLRKSFFEVAKSDAEPIEIEQVFLSDSEEDVRMRPMVLKDDPHFQCPDMLSTLPVSIVRSVVKYTHNGTRCLSLLELNAPTCDLLGMNVEEVQELLKAGYSKTFHHDDWVRYLKREVARIVEPRTGPTDTETSSVCRVYVKSGEAIPCIQITRARYNAEGLPLAKLIMTIPIPR